MGARIFGCQLLAGRRLGCWRGWRGSVYDALGRQTQIDEGAETLDRRTVVSYDDANFRVITSRDQMLSGDGVLTSVVNYDQLGRVASTQQLEGAATSGVSLGDGIKVRTRYLANDGTTGYSYKLVSNPFRAATSDKVPASETTMGWTLVTADQNGRTIASSSYAGASQPAPFGSSQATSATVATVYDGYTTTVTDEAGKRRTTSVDGLGRLSPVTEYLTSGGANYLTTYGYDALGDLTSVQQSDEKRTSSETRTFAYDSLKRLVAATNPENYTAQYAPGVFCADKWNALCYSYDANGNLTQKIDNRGVVINYAYL